MFFIANMMTTVCACINQAQGPYRESIDARLTVRIERAECNEVRTKMTESRYSPSTDPSKPGTG